MPVTNARKKREKSHAHAQMATARVRQRGVNIAEPYYAAGGLMYLKSEKTTEDKCFLPDLLGHKSEKTTTPAALNSGKACEWHHVRGFPGLKLLW